jgi:hypothetical protein
MKKIKTAILALALCGCDISDKEIEIVTKEKIEGFSYLESEGYKLQYPSEWIIIEPKKESIEEIEEKLREIGWEGTEYEWETEGIEASWYIKNEEEERARVNINLVSSYIKGLRYNDFEDEKFAEDFSAKNDEDLVALFGTTGEMAFIDASRRETFEDVFCVVCKYKVYMEPEDLCFYRAVFCADDSVNYLLMIAPERLFAAASEQMDIMLSSIEKTIENSIDTSIENTP